MEVDRESRYLMIRIKSEKIMAYHKSSFCRQLGILIKYLHTTTTVNFIEVVTSMSKVYIAKANKINHRHLPNLLV